VFRGELGRIGNAGECRELRLQWRSATASQRSDLDARYFDNLAGPT